jgi:hypothetical protein
MMTMRVIVALIAIIGFSGSLDAQAQDDDKVKATDYFKKSHLKLSAALEHARIRRGLSSGEASGIAASAWALNLDYFISEKWSVGLHNDIILENFQVLDDEKEVVDRHYPLTLLPSLGYELAKHFSLTASAGAELSKEKNYFMYRIGTEYHLGFQKSWEFTASFNYDFKVRGYNSWNIGMGIGKFF